MTLAQKEILLRGDMQAIWKKLKRGFSLTAGEWARESGSTKLTTRVGEIETRLGIRFKRVKIKTRNNKKCLSYSYREAK
jgi:hypothetical protein